MGLVRSHVEAMWRVCGVHGELGAVQPEHAVPTRAAAPKRLAFAPASCSAIVTQS